MQLTLENAVHLSNSKKVGWVKWGCEEVKSKAKKRGRRSVNLLNQRVKVRF